MRPGHRAGSRRGASGAWAGWPSRRDILAAVEAALAPAPYAPRSLDGLRVLVTAGGTREPIDSVRYVGNRSSGRMGLALADEAARRGAEVTLVAANVALAAPGRRRVVDGRDRRASSRPRRARAFADADVLLMAAAVGRLPARRAPLDDKITKTGRDGLALELEPTDGRAGRAGRGRARPARRSSGFAAEHGEGAVERGRAKLERKGLDAVVVNDISRTGHRLRRDRERGHDRAPPTASGTVPRGPKDGGRRGDPGRGGGAARPGAAGAELP